MPSQFEKFERWYGSELELNETPTVEQNKKYVGPRSLQIVSLIVSVLLWILFATTFYDKMVVATVTSARCGDITQKNHCIKHYGEHDALGQTKQTCTPINVKDCTIGVTYTVDGKSYEHSFTNERPATFNNYKEGSKLHVSVSNPQTPELDEGSNLMTRILSALFGSMFLILCLLIGIFNWKIEY